MARFFPRWLRATLAVLTALSTHVAHAALSPGEIADFSNELALDTLALKDLVNEIVTENNGGALQDVFEQYNHIINTLGAQFQYLPGTSLFQDASAQQSVFEAYSNFVQGLLELNDAVIAGAEVLVDLDTRNYFNFPAAETNLQSVFDPYAFNIISLYADDNDIHQQMVVQKSRVDASILRANAAIHSTNEGVPPVADPNPPANVTLAGNFPSTSVPPGSPSALPRIRGRTPTGTAPISSMRPATGPPAAPSLDTAIAGNGGPPRGPSPPVPQPTSNHVHR